MKTNFPKAVKTTAEISRNLALFEIKIGLIFMEQCCTWVAVSEEALAMWRYLIFRLPGTAADQRNIRSQFSLLPGVIRLPRLKSSSDQKIENILVACHIANAKLYVRASIFTEVDKYVK